MRAQTASGADLWVDRSGSSERHFLIPTGTVFPSGPREIVRIDGLRAQVDLESIVPFEVTADEAQTFHDRALADAKDRLAAGLGVVASLIRAPGDGELGERPTSLDQAAGLGGGDDVAAASELLDGLQRIMHLAQTDPQALQALSRQVAAQWQGTGVEGVAEALPAALREGLAKDEP